MKQFFVILIVCAAFAALAVWGGNAIERHREISRVEKTLENFRADQQSAESDWDEIKDSVPLSEEESLWMFAYAEYNAYKAADFLCKEFDCTSPFADDLEDLLKRLGAIEYNIVIDDTLRRYADVYTRKVVMDEAVKVMERILDVKKGIDTSEDNNEENSAMAQPAEFSFFTVLSFTIQTNPSKVPMSVSLSYRLF